MNVTKQWLSQSNGCHKVMDVTKQWLSQSNGSQRFGGKSRTKASFSHLQLSLFEGKTRMKAAFVR